MKMLITTLVLISSPAYALYQTTIYCGVVTWEHQLVANPAKYLFSENVTLIEGQEKEIYRTNNAVYVAYLEQHETKIDGTSSSLHLRIMQVGTDKVITDASAHWPRRKATGRMKGLGSLYLATDMAESNVQTQFVCDSRLKK